MVAALRYAPILIVLGLCGSASPALSQTTEAGLTWGQGGLNYADDKLPGGRHIVGAEVCLRCDKGRSLVADYLHWGTPDVNQDACARYWKRTDCTTVYRGADTVVVGVRFQGDAKRRVRMFGDTGYAYAYSRARQAYNLHGFAGTLGATIGSDRLYVRLGARLMFMSRYYAAANATVGAGWRF